MKLKNPFSPDTRKLFFETRFNCFTCGRNDTELNHTASRISDSPLNASVLCKACHASVGHVLCKACHASVGHTEDEEKFLFEKTLRYLMTQEYVINEKDLDFINNYKRLKQVIHGERSNNS
jgi:hypothetical protein